MTSTVSVVGVENPHNISDHDGLAGEEILSTIAGSMTTLGNKNVKGMPGDVIVALGPEYAATIAGDGFSKQDVRDYLYEKAEIPRKAFHKRIIKMVFPNMSENALIPPTVKKENLIIIMVGGPSKHSSYIPGFDSRLVIKAIPY